jgi:hypothetical protein
MRWLVALICFMIALFCGYGLLASFEPGAGMAWKIGYGFGAICFLALAFYTARKPADGRAM